MKKMILDMPIGRKLTAMLMLISVSTLFIASSIVLTYEVAIYRNEIPKRLEVVGRVIAENISTALTRADKEKANSYLLSWEHEPDVLTASIFDLEGRLVGRYTRLPEVEPGEERQPEQKDREVATGGVVPERALTAQDAERASYRFVGKDVIVLVPISADSGVLGTLEIVSDMEEWREELLAYLKWFGAVVLLCIAVSAWLSRVLQRFISVPLVDLAKTMQLIAQNKDYSLRVERTSKDETGELIDGFNTMLGEILLRDQALDRQRQGLEEAVVSRTRELAEATNSAQQASRTKTQFLANMSHEIRTPMNAVLGLSELLLDSGLSGVQYERARDIRGSSQALLGVINDVLDVSRIEAGQFELHRRRFELRTLLKQLQAMLMPLAESKALSLEVGIDPEVPQAVLGDEGRLRQILVNLVGNAIKFTDRGRVRIEVACAPMDTAQAVTMRIRVTDSGIGIAPDKIEGLFNRFEQVDSSDTRAHGGTGLGLYIARELARRMGGDVKVQSVPGVGSVFEVELRLDVAGPQEESHRAEAPSEAGGSLAVLVVEDNEINRMVARAMLEAGGHRVTEAVNGAQAVERCSGQAYDCVLMDCQMPVMDGVEATRQIRGRETALGARRTPIVALTANAMQGDRERYLAAGMDSFLAKPYERSALLKVLGQVTQGAPSVVPVADSSDATEAIDATNASTSFAPHALDELLRLEKVSPGMLKDLVSRFLLNTPGLIAKLDGQKRASLKEMELTAHSLKSTGALFGAEKVAALASLAEVAARNGSLSETQRLGEEIRTEYQRFEGEFRRHPAVSEIE